MSNRLSFSEWLLNQVHRDDPVGDLARDFRDDPRRPTNPIGYGRMKPYLVDRNASDGAMRALEEANREYRSS